MEQGGYIYIMTNKTNKVLYVGVTSNLSARVYEHKSNIYTKSFTARYNVHKLVYFEVFDSIEEAIEREKLLKKWQKAWKYSLIEKSNQNFDDLYDLIKEDYT
ncbi:MAG: hypothetical protein CVU05_08170 [Bacteroidetes bacterium HGW-Bacteroidetes-21]|nr:MAG: hypothetical protein CVU05_08170 [Bacteroidetes bacterium HGW-Bacteroidetes-21]